MTAVRTLYARLDGYVAGSERSYLRVEVLASIVVLLLPAVMTNPYHLRVVEDVAIFTLLALGLNLIFGFTGQISLGHAAFYAVGGYSAAVLQVRFDVPLLLSWVSAVALGMFVAWLLSFPLSRLHGHYLALGTLALGLIVETLLVQQVSLTGGHDGTLLPASSTLGPWMSIRFPYVVLAAAVIGYWLVRNLTSGSVGRALRALRDDPAGAAALGVEVSRYKTIVFVIAGGMAAAAGVLYAHHAQVVTPEVFSFHTSVQVLLMVVIGGMASRFGSVLGAAMVVVLPEAMNFLNDAKNLTFALLVLTVLLFLPGGLAGLPRAVRDAVRRRRSGVAR